MRRPFGAESHAVGATILPRGNAPSERDVWTLGDLVLWAHNRAYGSSMWLLSDVAMSFLGDCLATATIDVQAWRLVTIPSDWRERGWCEGLHEVTPATADGSPQK